MGYWKFHSSYAQHEFMQHITLRSLIPLINIKIKCIKIDLNILVKKINFTINLLLCFNLISGKKIRNVYYLDHAHANCMVYNIRNHGKDHVGITYYKMPKGRFNMNHWPGPIDYALWNINFHYYFYFLFLIHLVYFTLTVMKTLYNVYKNSTLTFLVLEGQSL